MNEKVAIIYGWAEGPWHGKELRKSLKKSGFKITKFVRNADIIIAHSGGCLLIPENSRANIIMLIGIPYWPNKHPLISLREKIRAELKDLYWYKKTLFNNFYFVSRPRKWLRIWFQWKKKTYQSHENAQVIVVRNEEDHFMHPTDSQSLADSKGWGMHAVKGTHDDLWRNPEAYINLILKYLKS